MRNVFLVLLCIPSILLSQNLQVLSNPINFGTTDESTPVNGVLRLYNPHSQPIRISGVDNFPFFGSEPFEVADTQMLVFPGDTVALEVGFLPIHNVLHNQPLIIRTSSGFGHLVSYLQGQGNYTLSYYQATQNKEGAALRSALSNAVTSGYTSLGYTNARDNMYGSIDNNNGQVECVYTGRTATFSTRSGANANNFNTEHSFPQGFFSQNEPMRSDIHHLFPTDVAANSQRGNDPFGVVTNANWSQGGSKSGGGIFEPRDAQKGATARAMMYFVLRYQDYSNHFQNQQNILYQWHFQHLPTSSEKQRNSDIANLQNNRNPFVDYPQLKARMSALVGSADLPDFKELYHSDDTIHLARFNNIGGYSFLVYNRGREAISLYDWQLSHPSLGFSPFLNDTVNLTPGMLVEIQITYDGTLNYQSELLTFKSNIGGVSNYQIPIYSDADFGFENKELMSLDLYPNPAGNFVFLKGIEQSIVQCRAISMAGSTYSLNYNDRGRIDLSRLESGFYLFELVNEAGIRSYHKLLIRK